MQDLIHSYGPVVDRHCQTLILGTAPSVQSLKSGFYYGHPRNAFWPIMARLTHRPLPGSIDEKKALLLHSHIALWDVVHSCVRPGSLDADMRGIVPNDFADFFAAWPGIRRIFLNGGTAHALFLRHARGSQGERPLIRLPSTSPAYTLPFDRKCAAWLSAFGEEIP